MPVLSVTKWVIVRFSTEHNTLNPISIFVKASQCKKKGLKKHHKLWMEVLSLKYNYNSVSSLRLKQYKDNQFKKWANHCRKFLLIPKLDTLKLNRNRSRWKKQKNNGINLQKTHKKTTFCLVEIAQAI